MKSVMDRILIHGNRRCLQSLNMNVWSLDNVVLRQEVGSQIDVDDQATYDVKNQEVVMLTKS